MRLRPNWPTKVGTITVRGFAGEGRFESKLAAGGAADPGLGALVHLWARRRVGRQTAVEYRTDLGVVRRSRHHPQQRRRLDVIRAHALRVFRLIFMPVGMHAHKELVKDQA